MVIDEPCDAGPVALEAASRDMHRRHPLKRQGEEIGKGIAPEIPGIRMQVVQIKEQRTP